MRPRAKPLPFAETYRAGVSPARNEREQGTHQVTNELSVELSDEQTEVRAQEKEARVRRDEEDLLARRTRDDNLEDCTELAKELAVDSHACGRRRRGRSCGPARVVGREERVVALERALLRGVDHDLRDGAPVRHEQLAGTVREPVAVAQVSGWPSELAR